MKRWAGKLGVRGWSTTPTAGLRRGCRYSDPHLQPGEARQCVSHNNGVCSRLAEHLADYTAVRRSLIGQQEAFLGGATPDCMFGARAAFPEKCPKRQQRPSNAE